MFASTPFSRRTRAQRTELNSAQMCRADTPRQEVKAHNGFSFFARLPLDLATRPRSPASSSRRIAWSSGSPMLPPASSMICKHSANRGDRRYIPIRESIGRVPSMGSVGLTPPPSNSRMRSGECSSNAPSRSASIDIVPSLSIVPLMGVVVDNMRALPEADPTTWTRSRHLVGWSIGADCSGRMTRHSEKAAPPCSCRSVEELPP